MSTDAQLLQAYAAEKSESAFAELVRRHLDLVYSAALRQVGGDRHRAQDVSQVVFTTLARKAGSLAGHPALAGWLYTATQHAAAKAMRTEWRRRAREQEAHAMQEMNPETEAAVDWDQVRPVLDGAMAELNERDRDAVVLRYFARRSFADIGAALRLSEDGARMRVERALEKLHARLVRRGVTSTAAAVGAVLMHQAVGAAPAGSAATIATGALGIAAASGSSVIGILTFMNTTYLGTVVTAAAAMIALGVAWQQRSEYRDIAAGLIVTQQENQIAAARVRELVRGAARAERELSEGQAAIAAARAASTTPNPTGPTNQKSGGPSPDVFRGKEFLAAHPEAQQLVDAAAVSFFADTGGNLIRELDLPPEESERIIAQAAKQVGMAISVADLAFNLGPMGRGGQELVDNRLRELLGEPRFQKLEELRRIDPARGFVKTVAGAIYDLGTPMNEAQADGLVKILLQHSPAFQSGGKVDPAGIDWTAVNQNVQELFSNPQVAALEAAAHQVVISRAMSPGGR